jgi:hypothetical protein
VYDQWDHTSHPIALLSEAHQPLLFGMRRMKGSYNSIVESSYHECGRGLLLPQQGSIIPLDNTGTKVIG